MLCPDCAHDVHESSRTCPSCGCPIGRHAQGSVDPEHQLRCQHCAAALLPLPQDILQATVRCHFCTAVTTFGSSSPATPVGSDPERTREQPLVLPGVVAGAVAPSSPVSPPPQAYPSQYLASGGAATPTTDAPVAKSVAELIGAVTALVVIAGMAGLVLWFPIRGCSHCGGDGRLMGLVTCRACHGDGSQTLVEILFE